MVAAVAVEGSARWEMADTACGVGACLAIIVKVVLEMFKRKGNKGAVVLTVIQRHKLQIGRRWLMMRLKPLL